MSETEMDHYILNNGLKMPRIGFGTYRIKNKSDIFSSLDAAIQSGYRHIDTAQVYQNESFIGDYLNSNTHFTKHRNEYFITSKLNSSNQGYEKCCKAIEDSRLKLKLESIDLYLIHWPGSRGLKHSDPKNKLNRLGSWKALEEFYNKKLLKSIGVSNYTHAHMKELLENCSVKPQVLQIELHPLYYPKDVIELCKEHNITVVSYSSLGEGELVKNEKYTAMIHKEGMFDKQLQTYQILLSWCLHHSFAVIPKSTNPKHIQDNIQNANIKLNDKQVEHLDALHISSPLKFCWDPECIL